MERMETVKSNGWKSKPLSRIVSRDKPVYELALDVFKSIGYESFRRKKARSIAPRKYPYEMTYSFIPRLYEDGIIEKKSDIVGKRSFFIYRFLPEGIEFIEKASKLPKLSIIR